MTELLSMSNRLTMSSVCGLERLDKNHFRSTGIYCTDDGLLDAGAAVRPDVPTAEQAAALSDTVLGAAITPAPSPTAAG